MKRRGTPIIQRGQEHRRELVKLFNQLVGKYHSWQIWQDFIYLTAVELAQPFDFRQNREDEYKRIAKKYTEKERALFPQMFTEMVLAFEQEGLVDILGEIYMQLELFNKWKGQYFTPLCVAELMAKVTGGDIAAAVKESGYITVNKPSCGSGVMLIAFCKNAVEQKVNFQQSILFTAQDVDPVVAQMCFISLSLLGMAGSVMVGNTILYNFTPENTWYTPMYFSDVWHYRRLFKRLDNIIDEEGEGK
jgi:type I restriction-modification system DNA methylase subunit